MIAANLKKVHMPLAPPTSDVEMGHPASENSELEGNGFKEDDYFRYLMTYFLMRMKMSPRILKNKGRNIMMHI